MKYYLLLVLALSGSAQASRFCSNIPGKNWAQGGIVAINKELIKAGLKTQIAKIKYTDSYVNFFEDNNGVTYASLGIHGAELLTEKGTIFQSQDIHVNFKKKIVSEAKYDEEGNLVAKRKISTTCETEARLDLVNKKTGKIIFDYYRK